MKKFILFSMLLFALWSCYDNGEPSDANVYKDDFEHKSLNALRIDPDKEDLSDIDAQNVATIFLTDKNDILTKSNSQSATITTFRDEASGKPLFYIVNFEKGGFALISASKKYRPILAYSTTGHFSLDTESPMQLYIDEYKEVLKNAIEDSSDTLRVKHALEWVMFERRRFVMTRSIPSELNSKIQAEIRRKEALGYEHLGNITSAAHFLTPQNYQNLLAELQDITDPQYDYKEVNQFFIKPYTYVAQGAMMDTKWHQGAPFNIDAPNGYAGCVPIAVAQIANFHKFPNKYNWTNIVASQYSTISPHADFVYFIKDIRNLCNVEYNVGGTGAKLDDAVSAFSKLGYNATTANYNTSAIKNSIDAGNPIFMSGINDNGKGHAWVCDAYKSDTHNVSISFIPSADDHRFKFELLPGSIFVDYNLSKSIIDESILTQEYFRMNPGWGQLDESGNCNIWVNEVFDELTQDKSSDKYPYMQNRSIITVKPNRNN